MQPKTFVFIGRSGCGKGTQASLLTEKVKSLSSKPIYSLSTGERMRQFIKGDNFSQSKARQLMESGDLQPSFVAIYTWSSLFIENLTGNEHLMLDGTPRKLDEAIILDNAFEFYNRDRVAVINLDVSEDWSRSRLLDRGRDDDKILANIDKRLGWYNQHVAPAVEHYANHDVHLFLKINGEQPIEKVHEDIMAGLADYLNDKTEN